jgi:hypothetical protein
LKKCGSAQNLAADRIEAIVRIAALVTGFATRKETVAVTPPQRRPSLRNFSRKRPETTNLNHQYTIRRVFTCHVLDTEMALHALNSRKAGGSV